MPKRASARTRRQARLEPWRLDPAFPVLAVDFRHAAGAHPPHHLHGALELAWCRAGHGSFLLEDEAAAFRAGDVFAIGGSVAHAARAASDAPSDWTFVFADVAAVLGASSDPALVAAAHAADARFSAGDSVAVAVAALVDELRARRPLWRDAVRARLIEVLVACARRRPRPRASSRSLRRLRALEPALAWMAETYAAPAPPPPAALARRCGLSVSQFRRVFAAQCGCSPRAWILERRVRAAAALLAGTSRGIADIAHTVGFVSLSSFDRQFRRRHGCSATRWRARHQREG